MHYVSTDHHLFKTAGTERLRITSAGKLLINTNVASGYNDRMLSLYNNGACYIEVRTPSNQQGGIIFSDGTAQAPESYQGYIAYEHTCNSMFFVTNTSERLRITSAGKLLYGDHRNDRGAELQYEGSQHTCMGVHRNGAHHGAPAFVFSASRGTSAGSNTIVQNGDYLGMISFKGTDGSDLANGAYITGIVDGTPGSNDMPTRLGFWTSADGSESPTERLTIDSSGRVTKPQQPRMFVKINSTTTLANAKMTNWATAMFNVGSLWDESNKRIVAPTDGAYLIGGNFRIGAPGHIRVVRFNLQHYNTSNQIMAIYGGGVGGSHNYDDGSSGYDHPYVSFTNMIYMAANTYVELHCSEVAVQHTSYIQVSNEQSHLWACLLQ